MWNDFNSRLSNICSIITFFNVSVLYLNIQQGLKPRHPQKDKASCLVFPCLVFLTMSRFQIWPDICLLNQSIVFYVIIRVHRCISQSGDTVQMDSTSNIDREEHKIFHLCCPSAFGGLPLATLIISREDEPTLTYALSVLKDVLPPYAFFGNYIIILMLLLFLFELKS